MGVHGLWRLIEPSGKPVPLETLENKVLAVDVSIWLHQAIKGFQDSKGAPIPNAHLLGIYHRVSKLLYLKIKPIFVFDGGVPALKKQTIVRRNQLKSRNMSDAGRLQKQLLDTILKHTAVSKVLSEKTKASIVAQAKTSNRSDMYLVPPSEFDSALPSTDSEADDSKLDIPDSSQSSSWDLHTIDLSSSDFKFLPLEVRHEILTDLKDTRKQNSWGRIQEIPKQSDDFSFYQMKRLLKRQSIQSALDQVSQEMGGSSLSLAELEMLFEDRGILTTNDKGKTIASNENIKYFYIKDVKDAIEKANKDIEKSSKEYVDKETFTKSYNNSDNAEPVISQLKIKADKEEEDELQKAITLSLQEVISRQNEDIQSESSFEELDAVPQSTTLLCSKNCMATNNGVIPNQIQKNISERSCEEPIKCFETEPINEIVDVQTISGNGNIYNDLKSPYESESSICNASEKGGNKPIDFSNVVECIGSNAETSSRNVNLEEIKSDSSESCDFMEVSDMEAIENSVFEIEVDPLKGNEDDLFADIFYTNEDANIINSSTLRSTQELDPMIKEHSLEEQRSLEVVPNPLITKFIPESKMVKEQESEKYKVQNHMLTENVEKLNNNTMVIENSFIKQNDAAVDGNLSVNTMKNLQNDLQIEKDNILKEKAFKERVAGNITDQMYQEAQELLELFGVPYIIAPMEAEAQCAFLDGMNLTDGTITDDSDIWLFGGKTVYKNFFNQNKYVMEFKAENIQHHFKLNREQMVLLALLVGSDYTTGIQGIGPVTALEILAAFPPSQSTELSLLHNQLVSGLKKFKSWFKKEKNERVSKTILKNKLNNIIFTENFPSTQVVEAYLNPKVETSTEMFFWAKPDIITLTNFAKEKFGWSSNKTKEILNPIVKRLEESYSQKSIRDYFKTKIKVHSDLLERKISKRVKSAIEKFGKTEEELMVEEKQISEKKRKKKELKSKCIIKEKSMKKKISNSVSEQISETEDTGNIHDSNQTVCQNQKITDNSQMEESQTALEKLKQSKKSNHQKKKEKHIPIKLSQSNDLNLMVNEDRKIDDPINQLKVYETLAAELKIRRKIKTELQSKNKDIRWQKQKKTNNASEPISKNSKEDEDGQMLLATTSRSDFRVDKIDQKFQQSWENTLSKKVGSVDSRANRLRGLKNKEIIHQKLRDKTDLLRNKMKAIEVFRRSKKGPGFVEKRKRTRCKTQQVADLSEDSDD